MNIDIVIDQVLADNPKTVEDYRNGVKGADEFLFGQVLREIRNEIECKLEAKAGIR